MVIPHSYVGSGTLHAGGSWEAALVLLSQASETKPDLAVCNAALSACGNSGLWQTLGIEGFNKGCMLLVSSPSLG